MEFKGEEHRALSDQDLVETVACLANRSGESMGWLLVGVEDDGRISGARPRHEAGYTEPGRVTALVSNRTRPSLAVRVFVVPIEDKEVIVIEVPLSHVPVGTSEGKYVRRAVGSDGKPACLPMQFHEMQAMQASRGMLDYSALVVPEASWTDLDPLEFERFRRNIRERRGRSDESLLGLPDLELAKALGAVEANGEVSAVRVLGLLLFGQEQALRHFLPTHEVAFQVLSEQRVAINDFFRWPLLRVMEQIESQFRTLNREQEILVGMLRVGVPDFPPAAFREGLANALIHRDYTRLGAVHVQWHDEYLEISNPGGFPEGVRLDNLLVTAPRPRNPLLADAFKRAGIVERTARGIDTIFFEQLRNGRPAPSYERSNESGVTLILPGGDANLDFVRLLVEESQAGRALHLNELLILNELWLERQTTTAQAASLMQRPEAEARAVLTRLAELGLIEARGEKKGRLWHLSASTYRRLGEHAAYVRQRGFEPLQQEQMVLQYVETHGRITRREVEDLCKLAGPQAYRLLSRLAQHGLLEKVGTRGRNVEYRKSTKKTR